MAETKGGDPAIKLFGKTIPLQEIPLISPRDSTSCTRPSNVDDDDDDDDDNANLFIQMLPSSTRNTNDALEDIILEKENKKVDQDKTINLETNQVGVSYRRTILKQSSNLLLLEEEKAETSSSQDNKISKKPDKILPCPRCNSLDTKFCYYNNYNVNQPRHFCKNCQRYWTVGGTMRNVPVGAGRRKNKNSTTYRHVTIPESVHNTRIDIKSTMLNNNNGTILSFSSDTPLCESMASILNLAEKTAGHNHGSQKQDESNFFISGSTSKNDARKLSVLKEQGAQNCLPFSSQISCYPGPPMPYPWSSTQWTPPITTRPFCPNGFAMPFYHGPPYWGCSIPETWNLPLVSQASVLNHSNPNSDPNSPLGKHSRDGNIILTTSINNSSDNKELNRNISDERSFWMPKTSKIDDPGEIAKTSIWTTTLGIIKNDKPNHIGQSSGGFFKAFQSKHDEGSSHSETSFALESDPTASSRSHNLQENS